MRHNLSITCMLVLPATLPFSACTQPAVPFIHSGSGFTFPATVSALPRVATTKYNAEGSDVSAGYNDTRPGHEMAITVYVYPQVSRCDQEFAKIQNEIVTHHPGSRLVSSVSARAPSPTASIPGMKAIYTFPGIFAGRQQELHSEAELFCGLQGKWLVEYRTTAPLTVDYSPELQTFETALRWPGRPSSK